MVSSGRATDDARATVTVFIDGEPFSALRGQTLAVALSSLGIHRFGQARHGGARSLFCGIGNCYQCIVSVDGLGNVRACTVEVEDGMRVWLRTDPVPRANPYGQATTRVEEDVDLAVVGAGPSGVSAAVSAAELGVGVVLLDEQPQAGGQIFRRPVSGDADPGACIPPHGRELLRRLQREPRIRHLTRTTVWAITPEDDGLKVAFSGPQTSGCVHARTVVVATGAYDRPVAFPGWSLPGVIGAGGVQALLKSHGVLPGRRFALVGSHPLLLVVARDLLRAGAEIQVLALAQRVRWSAILRELPALWGGRERLGEVLAALSLLRRHRVPILFGYLVDRAAGEDRVASVWLRPVDEQWRDTRGPRYHVDADTLVLGYGFSAASELVRQAGARCRWAPHEGGWICCHDQRMETSIPGLYVAGEVAGVHGAGVAMVEGTIAGMAAAARLGYVSEADLSARLQRAQEELRRQRRFAESLARLTAPRDGLFELLDNAVEVCRCEGLTCGALRTLLAQFPHVDDVNALKLLSRAGMGMCQGRLCEWNVRWLTAEARGLDLEQVGAFQVREPVKPVRIADIVGSP